MPKPLCAALAMLLAVILCQCAPNHGKLMGGPTLEQRQMSIATERAGDFYYGRRYHVDETRFWGYLRKPRQPWSSAKLVMMREDQKLVPDRLPEYDNIGRKHGYDQNFEYRITGYYMLEPGYCPNSNQRLPVFMLTGYELVDQDPGWLFTPEDRYHPKRITLRPR